MNGFAAWLRRLGNWIIQGFRSFMAGRYGTDKLNMALLTTGFVVCIVSVLVPVPLVDVLLTLVSYALLFWAVFRSLSRNTYKRYQENRRYLLLIDRFMDREHRYFDCPKCRQSVRVPRGKGKIAITCPKCREKFIKKT